VKDTLHWIAGDHGPNNLNFVVIDSIKIREDNFIDIYCHRGLKNLQNFIAHAGIFKSEDIMMGRDHLNKLPPTTGVYYLYYKSNEKVILKKNLFHRDYKKNEKAPDVVELIVEPNHDKQFSKLLKDELDFVQHLALDIYQKGVSLKKYQIIEGESDTVIYLLLNGNSPEISSVTPKNNNQIINNPLQDQRVRRAIAHAIDTKSFIKETVFSKAIPLILPDLRSVHGYPAEPECYKFDLELSRGFMRDAGHEDGFRMNLYSYQGKFSTPLAIFIQNSLREINIDVRVSFVSFQDLSHLGTDVPASIHAAGGRGRRSLISSMMYFYHSDPSTNTRNLYRNHNQKINDLIDELDKMYEFDPNFTVLKEELIQEIIDQAYVIPFMNPLDIFILCKKFTYTPTTQFYFTNFSKR
jgi:ABC-type transport system substrate-binding protein